MVSSFEDVKSLVFDYPLNSESVVFELGGHVGLWPSTIVRKFNPYIYIFEPVQDFYMGLVSKFEGNDKVRVFNYGISYKNDKEIIYVDGDASSLIMRPGIKQDIVVRDIFSVVDEHKLTKINLIQINIEGGEYSLLEHILNSGRVNLFDNIQIQFHKNVDNYESKRLNIKSGLSKTHREKFDLPFIFESWTRINSCD